MENDIFPGQEIEMPDYKNGHWVKINDGSARFEANPFVHKQYIIADYRGEKPESPIHSDPGALRGDAPLSKGEAADEEIK